MNIRYWKGLQVATETYEKNGRQITLIGTVHIGDAEFWEGLTDLIEAKEVNGAEVHYESTVNDMENPPNLGLDYKLFADVLGLVDQKTGLAYKDTWVRTDLTLSELLAHADPVRLARHEKNAESLDHTIHQLEESEQLRGLVHKAISFLVPLIENLPVKVGSAGIPRSVLIGQRNGIAAQAALTTDKDVVAIWGAGHVHGIGKLLKKAGFTRTSRHWRTAVKPNARVKQH